MGLIARKLVYKVQPFRRRCSFAVKGRKIRILHVFSGYDII